MAFEVIKAYASMKWIYQVSLFSQAENAKSVGFGLLGSCRQVSNLAHVSSVIFFGSSDSSFNKKKKFRLASSCSNAPYVSKLRGLRSLLSFFECPGYSKTMKGYRV